MKTSEKSNILVVSQNKALAGRVEKLLDTRVFSIVWESNLNRALDRFEKDTFAVLILTAEASQAGDFDGIELLEIIAAKSSITQCVFLVEAQDIKLAMSALQVGTYQYAKMPVSDMELRMLIETAIEKQPEFGSNQLLKSVDEKGALGEIIGRAPVMQEVYRQIRLAAATDIPVLIQGETGTGKDLAAQAIHRQSERADGIFVPVNLGALPSELIGSELFGHEKGAFTGAVDRRQGKFEQAKGGTVFLDEIGTVDEKVQISLLRLIEQKKFHRLGGRQMISTDVRLVTATNEDLVAQVRQGLFREDLFYRLDVFRIVMPSLRQREGDVSLLVDVFLERYNREFEKEIAKIDPDCLGLLNAYAWPGNVRELKNVVQRAVLVCEDNVLLPEHLPPRFQGGRKVAARLSFEIGTPLDEVEREMIVHTLEATGNNRKEAAEILGISRRSLYNRLKKYQIE